MSASGADQTGQSSIQISAEIGSNFSTNQHPTPWTRCDREADYRQAWAEFERRLGKKDARGDSTVKQVLIDRRTPWST